MATASGVERKKNWTTRTLFFIVSLLFVWACFGLRGWGLGFFFSNNFCSWGSWKRLKRFEMMETETKTNQSIFRPVFWFFFFLFFFLHFQPTFCEFVFVVIPIVRSFIHLAWRDEKKREIGKASKRKSTKKTKTNQPTNPPPPTNLGEKKEKKNTNDTQKEMEFKMKEKDNANQTRAIRFNVASWLTMMTIFLNRSHHLLDIVCPSPPAPSSAPFALPPPPFSSVDLTPPVPLLPFLSWISWPFSGFYM